MRVTADNGTNLDIEDLVQTLAWNADGTLNYIEVSLGGTYRQTYTWTSGKLTSISKWELQ